MSHSHTFHALVLKLIAQKSGALPGSVGELAHAAFYGAIQAVDPALAQAVHDAEGRKPFSLSPLFGYRQCAKSQGLSVAQGQEGWLRVGLLEPDLFRAFAHHLLSTARPTIRLGDLTFAVSEVLGNPHSHPWAGYTTLDELRQLGPWERWTLEFASPTAVRWGDADNGRRRVEVFPLPRMFVNGLRKRWDEWTGESWRRDFEVWVERNVIVERVWHWQTQPFAYKRQRYVGGVGKIGYRLLDTRDKEKAAHLNRLLHLAFFTGAGYKTTHGLGMVRVSAES